MDIWGEKDIRTSWCLSIFLWMRNQPSQWNTLWKLWDSTRWDSLWGGSYRRRIGFLWLLGHPKIYRARKITLGGGGEGKVIHLGRELHSPLCTESFQSPAGLHAYHASLNELLFPAATCLFHLQTHIHTWLGWTQLAGRPRSPPEHSQVQLSQPIYLQMYTHTYTTCTQTLHIHNTLGNGIYHEKCSFNTFCTSQTKKNKTKKNIWMKNIHWETLQKSNFQSLHSRGAIWVNSVTHAGWDYIVIATSVWL